MNQIELARRIATEAHKGQTRRDRVTPYITHPEAVAKILEEDFFYLLQDERIVEDAKAVALLHDVIEDTPTSYSDLLKAGIDPSIARHVMTLTRFKGESYLQYILNVASNPLTAIVKLADIKHNSSDLEKGSMRDKYELATHIIKTVRGIQ